MKILQVNKLYYPSIGGVETAVRDIAEGLRDRADMHILACQSRGRRKKEMINGVAVTRAASFGSWFSMPISLDFLRLYKILSKDAEVIQLHAPFPLADLALFLFRRKGKVVVWWHSDIVRQKFFRWLLTPMINHALRRADAIIVSDDAVINASSFLHVHRPKCRIIPYGLDFSAYPVIESKVLQPKQPGVVKLLFVGRLVYYKGIEVLIRSMRAVNNAELFIVGSGKLEASLKNEVHRSGMENKIHFLGALPPEDLLAAYCDCDVFIFPSIANSEAFGICQLEAMYYGKPVINTSLPTAVPTVSLHGVTGLTVPPGDTVALAAAVNTLVKDNVLRKKYGMAAAQRVRDKYDRSQMIGAVYKIYEDCL